MLTCYQSPPFIYPINTPSQHTFSLHPLSPIHILSYLPLSPVLPKKTSIHWALPPEIFWEENLADLLKDVLFSASIVTANDGVENGSGVGVGVGVGVDEKSIIPPQGASYGTPYGTPNRTSGHEHVSVMKGGISTTFTPGGPPTPTAFTTSPLFINAPPSALALASPSTRILAPTPLRGVATSMIRYYLIDHGQRVPLYPPEPRAVTLLEESPSSPPSSPSRLSSRPSSSSPPQRSLSPSFSSSTQQQQQSQQQSQQQQPQTVPLSQLLSLSPGNYKFLAVFEPDDAQWRELDSNGNNTPSHPAYIPPNPMIQLTCILFYTLSFPLSGRLSLTLSSHGILSYLISYHHPIPSHFLLLFSIPPTTPLPRSPSHIPLTTPFYLPSPR